MRANDGRARVPVVLLLVSGLTMASCKSADERSSDTSAVTTGAPATTPPTTAGGSAPATAAATTAVTAAPTSSTVVELGRGVSEDSIKLGVLYFDYSALKDVLPALDHGDYDSAFRAYATSINDAGGINGRRIELTFATIDPLDQSSAVRACTQLIEDEQVFAVLAPQLNPTGAQCVVGDHATPLIGGVQTADALAAAKAPWFTWDASAAYAAQTAVSGMLERGDLAGRKVAIVGSAAHQQLANDTAEQLRDAGIDVVGVATASANVSDQAAARAELQTFAERFRADGAESVIALSDSFVLFAQALQQTDYRPHLISTWTNNVLGFLVSATDYGVLDGLISVGPPAEQSAFTQPPAAACVERITAAEPDRSITPPDSPTARTPDTFVSVVQTCKALQLFTAIASNAGGSLNVGTFAAAGATLGQIELPMLGGPSNFSAEHPDGSPPLFFAEWDAAGAQLVYTASPIS